MKLLRESIRRILLENHRHYEHIVDMILTGELAKINQALELALTMEYVVDLQHTNPYTQSRSSIKHQWKMKANPGFEAEIKRQYRIDFKSKLQIFYGQPSQKPGEIKITLYVPSEI